MRKPTVGRRRLGVWRPRQQSVADIESDRSELPTAATAEAEAVWSTPVSALEEQMAGMSNEEIERLVKFEVKNPHYQGGRTTVLRAAVKHRNLAGAADDR